MGLLFVLIHAAFTVVLLHHLLKHGLNFLVEVLFFAAVSARILTYKKASPLKIKSALGQISYSV